MALNPQRFTLKPETVEAVQVTEENRFEVAEWCGGTAGGARSGDYCVDVPDDGERGYGGVAFVGEWVIRHGNGGFTTQPEHDDGWRGAFHDSWQPAADALAERGEAKS